MSNQPSPSPNPPNSERVQVMLPPEAARTFRQLAALQKRSTSALLREFLVEIAPVMQRTLNLLTLAQTAQTQWPKDVARRLEHAQDSLELTALGAMGTLDLVHAEATQPKPKAGRVAKPSPLPPLTNRGVTPHAKPREARRRRTP
jgi:hypothetical protein